MLKQDRITELKPQGASQKGTAIVISCAVVPQLAGGNEPAAGEWQGLLCAWELCAGLVCQVSLILCALIQTATRDCSHIDPVSAFLLCQMNAMPTVVN